MIFSGWILPNGDYICCESSSGAKEHIECVSHYLNKLRYENNKEYLRVIKEMSDISLDDFAVKKLGWIKVLNEPRRYVFYSRKNNIEYLKSYEKYGYTLVEV